jgi:hypothetical protein
MPIYVPGKVTLRQTYIGTDDPDAAAYIAAVEAADEIASPGIGGLETATKVAIHSFVKGCKNDGIWPALKASCILAGAKTLAGALVPLVGTAPTNFNFVTGDYNRGTGLVGNGSTKYLNSNRNNNADPQNSQHLAVWMSTVPSDTARRPLIGCGVGDTGASQLNTFNSRIETRSRTSDAYNSLLSITTGFAGLSRSNPSTYLVREGGAQEAPSAVSQAPLNETINVFRRNVSNAAVTNARLAFYSIGEALPDGPTKSGLQLLDERVSALINAFGVAIP